MTRKKHMCVNYKYNFFLKYFLSQEQLTVLIEPKTMVRTTLFLLAILVTGPAQSPMWAVKLVHLRTEHWQEKIAYRFLFLLLCTVSPAIYLSFTVHFYMVSCCPLPFILFV